MAKTVKLPILTYRCCGRQIDGPIVEGYTYWKGLRALFPSEAAKKATLQDEAIECQTIDADCNDCKHFKRGKMIASGSASAFEGHCLKFDKPTTAYPNFCTGHDCFEHRRA